MNCPNCGAPEREGVRLCLSCGDAFASEDLIRLQQLKYLVDVTEPWEVPQSVRIPYIQKLEELQKRLKRFTPEEVSIVEEAVPAIIPERPAETSPAEIVTEPDPEPKPAKEDVPFDQWLLSERNIKIALYGGGLLLVLAGLIFVGVNWALIPGPAKFTITLLGTGLMYLGGFLLFQRPAYRVGGIALLGIASGFFILNFLVLQIYVLGPGGLREDVMWLIASPICMLLYFLTAYWTKSQLFTYISLAALASIVTAALVVSNAPLVIFILSYSILAFIIFGLERFFRSTPLADFTQQSLLIVSQAGIPLVLLGAIGFWILESGCRRCTDGSPWLALLTLGIGFLFYSASNLLYKNVLFRWLAAGIFPLTLIFVLIEADLSDTVSGIMLMVLSFAYMGVGHLIERKEEGRRGAWPFYAIAYVVAILVTSLALPTKHFASLLFGDVALIGVSAAILRQYKLVYGAAWLFLLPIYLIIDRYVMLMSNQGLLLGLLGLNYTVAGYALGRRELRLGGPFLTGAALLSAIVIPLTWGNPIVASLILALITVLYVLVAVWLDWEWLTLPALLATNLAVLALNRIFAREVVVLGGGLIVSYTILGAVLVLGGYGLRRMKLASWTLPLYLIGAIDLFGAYLGGLVTDASWLSISISVVLASFALTFAWLERDAIKDIQFRDIPILSYVGILVMFIGHFYIINVVGRKAWDIWPALSAGVCGLFVVLSWFARRQPLAEVYSKPLRLAGLWLLIIPMGASLFYLEPVLGAVTFAIAGLTYAADAAMRKTFGIACLGLASFVVVIWAILMAFDVSEPQAYVIPPSLTMLGIGWIERSRRENLIYRVLTLLGLFLLMGSAFIQSISRGSYIYALLLLFESLLVVGFGIWRQLRGFVQVGVVALIANAIMQFGPAFAELPRWIQLGLSGGILLAIGLGALFKREEILSTRRKLSDTWREWEA